MSRTGQVISVKGRGQEVGVSTQKLNLGIPKELGFRMWLSLEMLKWHGVMDTNGVGRTGGRFTQERGSISSCL